jgi:hypothetical protein
MAIIISSAISAKLELKHGVSEKEVRQALENRTGHLLVDDREDHKTDPPTLWFIAPTNARRLLKVCFIHRDGNSYVRTAYEANDTELRIYRRHGDPSDF